MPPKRSTKNKVFAVITGDIVGSTKLTRAEMTKVREAISETVERFNAFNFLADYRNNPKDAEFSQGDTWQVVVPNPGASLRLALMIQAGLRHQAGAETRMAIGIGTIDSLEKSAGISTGEALTLSGRALENMSGAFRLTGALSKRTNLLAPKREDTLVEWFPGFLHLCGALTRSWTKRQAEVIGYWLTWPDLDLADATYEWVADEFKITKQSVGDILSSANLPPLRDALIRFQKTDWQHIAGPQIKGEA